jgi:hypothetical protein
MKEILRRGCGSEDGCGEMECRKDVLRGMDEKRVVIHAAVSVIRLCSAEYGFMSAMNKSSIVKEEFDLSNSSNENKSEGLDGGYTMDVDCE